MADYFQIFSVGVIKKKDEIVTIEIFEEYRNALLGLHEFSHIIVFYWFHKNDTLKQRNILQVHPRGDKGNPLTGVFASRSPARPNLIAIFTCKILSIDGNTIHVDKIDAFGGTPVIDIKPCISKIDTDLDIRVPEWAD